MFSTEAGLLELGFDLKEGESPIVPVMLYNAKLAQDVARDLYAEGVWRTAPERGCARGRNGSGGA
jgi:7-keto-8-aminopelargonate synthetase-like enzyme